MSADQNGHIDCLRKLITSGAEVNIQNKDGFTVLMVGSSEWTH